MNVFGPSIETDGVQFWQNPERAGWLEKQGTWLPTWRRRWFILKQGKLIWFKDNIISPESVPRGVIEIKGCIAIKGAEDSQVCAGKQHAFEISTQATGPQYFIAPDSRVMLVQEKEDWINAIGQAIVRQSRSALAEEQTDYM